MSMAALITSERRARRTIRITYIRSTDSYSVDCMLGDEVDMTKIGWAGPEEYLAEGWAETFSQWHSLPISQLDVP